MRFLVETCIEYRHVAGHFRIGKLNIDAATAGTSSDIGIELVPGPHVWKEISVPVGAPAPGLVQMGLRDHLGFGVEIHFVLNVRPFVGVAENKIHIAHTGQS